MGESAPVLPRSAWTATGWLVPSHTINPSGSSLTSFSPETTPATRPKHLARTKLGPILDAGVGVFIDLTEACELKPYAHLLPEGVKHVRFPIRDVSVPTDSSEMTAILDCIDAEIERGNLAYVHCWGGHGRTGTVVGCWLTSAWTRTAEGDRRAATTLAAEHQVHVGRRVRIYPANEATVRLHPILGSAAPLIAAPYNALIRSINRQRKRSLMPALDNPSDHLFSFTFQPNGAEQVRTLPNDFSPVRNAETTRKNLKKAERP